MFTSGFRTPPENSGLLAERRRLEKEIEAGEAELAVAHEQQAPYAAAFWSAHARLVEAHQRDVDKPLRLLAYDARVLAGHAWHPFRAKAQDIGRWLKLLRDELRAVNREIGT